MFKPLEGVRVIDLSQVLAGPFATYQLALMGAEVIKIEKPGEGDWTRVGGPVEELSARKMGLGFLCQNAEKKSVSINLKTDEGRDIVKRLAAGADVFVENFKPGVAARLGLGYDELKAENPKLVYCSISAYGQNGPLGPRPAYDHVIQGMCGIMKTTGQPGAGPTKVGAPYVDYATGMNAAFAILAGLREAEKTGGPVQLDVAMLDTSLMLMASLMTMHSSTGWVPEQSGNEAWSASPSSGAFRTADGTLMLAANTNAQFEKMCIAIGREDILHDPNWTTPEVRKRNAASLRETLNEHFLTRSAEDWEVCLSAASVPAARVRGLEEILHEEQIVQRGILKEIDLEGYANPVFVPSLSFLPNETPCTPEAAPSHLGSDTLAVLRDLGLDDQSLSALKESGTI